MGETVEQPPQADPAQDTAQHLAQKPIALAGRIAHSQGERFDLASGLERVQPFVEAFERPLTGLVRRWHGCKRSLEADPDTPPRPGQVAAEPIEAAGARQGSALDP